GGGKQGQVGQVRVGHGGPGQGTVPQGHVGKVHQRPVAESQRNIQVPKADVHVDAQHGFSQPGQTGGHSSGDRSLARPPFAGGDGDDSSHGIPPISPS